MTTTTESNGSALAVRDYPKLAEITGFSSAQINLVRQTVAPGASIVELAWYLYNARRLGLEPTLDQIYLIRYDRDGPAEIVIGINGYRAQAESSGAYAGSDDAEFEYEDVGQPKGAPSKASVTVWKIVQGMRVPFTASARWEEFYPGQGKAGEQYRKRPHNQLAVRAESHALRKAFPYQTGRLEAEPAPPMWVEAAEADESAQHAPALTAARANEHARIFGRGEDDSPYEIRPSLEDTHNTRAAQGSPSAQPARSGRTASDSPSEAAPPEPPAPPELAEQLRPTRAQLWQMHRDLANKAAEFGIDVPTLDQRSSEQAIADLNATLRSQIRQEEARLGLTDDVAQEQLPV